MDIVTTPLLMILVFVAGYYLGIAQAFKEVNAWLKKHKNIKKRFSLERR